METNLLTAIKEDAVDAVIINEDTKQESGEEASGGGTYADI